MIKRAVVAVGVPIVELVKEHALTSAVGLAAIEIGSNVFLHYRALAAPVEVFKSGVVEDIATSHLISRQDDLDSLSYLIRVEAPKARNYVVVIGEHGVGKTTLIQQVLNPKNVRAEKLVAQPAANQQSEAVPKGPTVNNQQEALLAENPAANQQAQNRLIENTKAGCVYISITGSRPLTIDDGDMFANVFGIRGQKGGVITQALYQLAIYALDKRPKNKIDLDGALAVIEKAAKAYYTSSGKIPILAIDNVNVLVTKSPHYLDVLQEKAKDWADRSVLTVVFVASDGVAPPRMRSNSSYSRASKFSVGGIPEPDAVKYLEEQGFNHALAEKVVTGLTGGKFSLLNKISGKYLKSYEVIQEILFEEVRDDIEALLNEVQGPAGSVIREIMDSPSKSILMDRFLELVHLFANNQNTKSVLEVLHRSQVISVMGNTVAFQSRAVQAFAVQHPNLFQPILNVNLNA